MNWYKKANQWGVKLVSKDVFQLTFNDVPILDYSIIEAGANIKEIKVYGKNFLKNVPKGTPLPPILFLYSRAKDLRNELV